MTSILVSPADAQGELASRLELLGVPVIAWPATNLGAPRDCADLNQAIEELLGYDWLILKNERAAEYFLRSFQPLRQPAAMDELRVLTVGEHTAEQLIESHIHVDVSLGRFSSTRVFSEIEAYAGVPESISGLNFLAPAANITPDSFAAQLADAGARIDSVTAYRTTLDHQKLTRIRALLLGGGIGCVAFTGPSSIDELTQLFDTDDLPSLLHEVETACFYQTTAAAAGAFGLAPTLITGGASAPHPADSILRLLG